jgi:hypothetical protein
MSTIRGGLSGENKNNQCKMFNYQLAIRTAPTVSHSEEQSDEESRSCLALCRDSSLPLVTQNDTTMIRFALILKSYSFAFMILGVTISISSNTNRRGEELELHAFDPAETDQTDGKAICQD